MENCTVDTHHNVMKLGIIYRHYSIKQKNNDNRILFFDVTGTFYYKLHNVSAANPTLFKCKRMTLKTALNANHSLSLVLNNNSC